MAKKITIIRDKNMHDARCSGQRNRTGWRNLKQQIKRLETILNYENKMNSTKHQSKKDYYKEGMRLLFADGENFDNYKQILEEYRQALVVRTELIKALYDEIKVIKKLRV